MTIATSTTFLNTNTAKASHCDPASAGASTSDGTAPSAIDDSQRIDLAVAGMTCGRCVNAVQEALNSPPGVAVDHVRIGRASVTLAEAGASPAALIEALRQAGYAASFDANADSEAQPRAAAVASCCSTR